MNHAIEQILGDLRTGDSTAGEELFQRYAGRIREIAIHHLDNRLAKKISPEDIVQSVFRSFFRRNQKGQFSFENWNSFWALLVTIAVRKCARCHREFSSVKRDIRRESELSPDLALPSSMEQSPTPADLVAMRDTVEWCLMELTEFQKQVILLRLANFSTAEISELVGRTQRTVRRILEKFRQRLESQLSDDQLDPSVKSNLKEPESDSL